MDQSGGMNWHGEWLVSGSCRPLSWQVRSWVPVSLERGKTASKHEKTGFEREVRRNKCMGLRAIEN